ncbi:MAG: Water Stress and Hypersensitive response [Magnetococcales bacterium]|nr:Water Stress and Hypersensitive response [Magnetococcales bacterium]HIJ83793.1 LEA type 2 family protein [Magnetococcales bacterium]
MAVGKVFWRGVLFMALMVVLSTGCSSLKVAPLQKLDVELLEIEPKKIAVFRQTYRVRFRLNNPNAEDLPVAALHATVFIEEYDFANFYVHKPFSVGAKGSHIIDQEVSTELIPSLDDLRSILCSKKETLNYHLVGTAQVDRLWAGDLAFEKSGKVNLKQKLEEQLD